MNKYLNHQVRPNIASTAIQKLISEAMTDRVDFSDYKQFIKFREKVIEAKQKRSASECR